MEDKLFEQRLFGDTFKYCRYLISEQEVVSILFALPCSIVSCEQSFEGLYIFAAATAKKHRGKGYMTALLELVKKESREVLFLRPASDRLISFYNMAGFSEFTAFDGDTSFPIVRPCADFASLAQGYTPKTKKSFTLMYYYKEKLNLENLNFIYSME